MICQQERKEEITRSLDSLRSPILAQLQSSGDIDITKDTKKVITKMKQNSQVIFLNGDFLVPLRVNMTLNNGFPPYLQITMVEYLVL